ncbi:hypothetical protein D3C87_1975430 [compost metagenome]
MFDDALQPCFRVRLSVGASGGGTAAEHAVDLRVAPKGQPRLDVAVLRAPQQEALSFQFGRGRR